MNMVTSLEDKFSFFLPFDIEKAKKDDNGNITEMKIKGVASTTQKDTDDEILEPSGFDVSKFLKSGFFNYQHLASKDPSTIVGEPTNAIIKDNKLHVEGFLYPDSEMAQKIYKTAEVLKKSSKTRYLGFSIEGKATERDPLNPKRITKASITGIAITPSPRNPGTNLEIVKGGIEAMDFSPEEGSVFLIDVTDENGIRTTVDKNFVIEKSEPATALESQEEVKKSDGTQEASTAEEMDGVTTKESVEGGKSALETLNKKKRKIEQDKKTFSKSETYEEIFSMFNCNVEDATRLYRFFEEVQVVLTPDMEKVTITKEAIQKASELLGLVKAEAATPVASAEDTAAEALKKADELKKAEVQAELDATLKKAEELKAQLSGAVKVEVPVETKIIKSEAPVAIDDKIVKSFDEKFSALGTLIQSKDEQLEIIKSENAELKRSLGDITAFNQALAQKIGMIAKQPLDRKSVTTDKFIEKGGNGNDIGNSNQLVTLSLSSKKDRAQLADVMFNAAISKGDSHDKELIKGVQTVELGSLGDDEMSSARLQQRLRNEFKINVVK